MTPQQTLTLGPAPTASPVISISPRASVEEAAGLMRDHDIGVLPVVDGDRLVGIVTDRDMVVRGIAERRDGWLSRVSDVMTKTVHACHVDWGLHGAAMLMAMHQLRRIPLIDNQGQLIGMVTLADLIHGECVGAEFASLHVSAPSRGSAP